MLEFTSQRIYLSYKLEVCTVWPPSLSNRRDFWMIESKGKLPSILRNQWKIQLIRLKVEVDLATKQTLEFSKNQRAPEQGLEPWTLRLKVWCSTDWAIQALLEKLEAQTESLCSVVLLFVTPWTVASQAPLSMGFSRLQARILEWVAISHSRGSSLCLLPALAEGFFTTEPLGKLST